MRPPSGKETSTAGGDGILAPGCPVRVLGQAAASGGSVLCVYEGPGFSFGLRALSPSQHTYLAVLDLLGSWARRLWPPPTSSPRAFDAKAAAAGLSTAVRAATGAAWRHRLDGRGDIAPGCPVQALGFARAGHDASSAAMDPRDRVCVYAVTGQRLHALRRHKRLAIMGMFAGHTQWLEHLWPMPPGRRHTWDAERAAEDLLDASARASFVDPPPLPGAEIIPFRRPPPPRGRL